MPRRGVLLILIGFALTLPQTERAAGSAVPLHWAFQPLKRNPPPGPTASKQDPIDRFIRAHLVREGLRPSPPADRPTLLRRLSFDLIGLPPTPEEIASFAADRHPGAVERQVDRLLASRHFGEKWARHWLDLAHYADTDGYLTDQLRPHAWRYRHWLVDALNRDLPFDRFTIEQLAGDLLPDASTETRVATGFLRQTLSNREGGADLEEFRVEQVVDRVSTVTTTWLGLTAACARCHDHKYDPISQREFFALYAIFDSADEVNLAAPLPGDPAPTPEQLKQYQRKRDELIQPLTPKVQDLQRDWERRMLDAASHPGRDYRWDREWEVLGLIWGGNLGEGQLEGCRIVQIAPERRTLDQQDRLLDYFLARGDGQYPKEFQELKLPEVRSKIDKLAESLPKVPRAATVMQTQVPRSVRLHVRGDFRSPGAPVSAGTPACLPPLTKGARPDRLSFARWLVSPQNPLTPRVAVNRVWQELFGTGLVQTSEDFGTRGAKPTHPELLDYLAVRFAGPRSKVQGPLQPRRVAPIDGGVPLGDARVANSAHKQTRARNPGVGLDFAPGTLDFDAGLEWSQKALIRRIVLTETYRQSSKWRADLAARDPYNRLLARQSALRLTSEQVRDAALSVSGLLNAKIGGPCVFPPQPASVVEQAFDNKWTPSTGADRYRRGLYTFTQRLSPFAQNDLFDAPTTLRSCTRRERSNSPLQALTLLNDPAFHEAATALANRLVKEAPDNFDARLDRAYRLCVGRPPTPAETARMRDYYGAQGTGEIEAWTGVASILLNLHEFITRD